MASGAASSGSLRVEDAYGRPFNNLRISVTNECNYRCIFCHIEGDPIGRPLRPGQLPPIMVPEEYGIVAKAAFLLGARNFKLTGGEPLIRRDIVDIVGNIAENAPGSDISMTTNGYLMKTYGARLAEAGLNRVNISVHSLRPGRYKFITGVDGLKRAIEGVAAARDAGLGLKVNMVVLKGINEDEIFDVAEFAHRHGGMLQLIELHPVGLGARFFKQYFYPLSEFEKKLLESGATVRRRGLHNRPVYTTPEGYRIEVVKPYSNAIFCSGCTRIRLSPTGELSPCLNYMGPRVKMLHALRAAKTWKEKVLAAARALLEVNEMRRPFWLVPLKDEPREPSGLAFNGKVTRQFRVDRIPRRSAKEKLLRELERLL